MDSKSCVSPKIAKKKLEDVKITIAGVDADNALDLLMKSLEKNLKGLTLDEFKEEVNEAISNKKQKAGKKSRVRKGKKGRRTKRGRGPGEKRKSDEMSSSSSVYENTLSLVSNVLTTIVIIVVSGGSTAGIVGIVNQLPAPYGTIFHALTGALYTCSDASSVAGSIQYSMRLVASYATGGMIASCSTNALSYERTLLYVIGLLITNLGITTAMTRESIYSRIRAFISRQPVEQTCAAGGPATTAITTTSASPETELPIETQSNVNVISEDETDNESDNEEEDAANALLSMKKVDNEKKGGKKARKSRKSKKAKKSRKSKKAKKSRKSRKSRK